MSEKTKIDRQALTAMNNLLYNEKRIGQIARPADLVFVKDGNWLKDTAVIDIVNKSYSGWDVILVFAHYKTPLKLIVRYITSCFSEPKAKASAFYFRKEAAKDRRGTLTVSVDDLDICHN